MTARPDPASPFRPPATGPVRAFGLRSRTRPFRPAPPPWDGNDAGSAPAEDGGSSAAEADAPSHTGFLTGRRGPRTTALLLTTGAIGSALAALLLASGVLTPTDPGGPSGLPPAPPAETSAAPAPSASRSAAPAPPPPATASPVPAPTSAPEGPVTDAPPSRPAAPAASGPRSGAPDELRPGDSGPAVSDLQARLRQVPEVYPGGDVDGRYDDEVARAVARFQQWYGIRGDEEGVYGDDTRRDLESRT
ncbi:peptidoglycan-binding domain-containing protein [Streptomyces sp. TRM 70361]|uniref:peptidoglycan-binding domain-containing protein n=1 Tax=Streptomyces sp. TRM 70361 TaxID=3116553 RepID=UPI002E7B1E12|nr:peptidoglycan-binding domain-containing protein [Streptomyces sp. TRM 70361]MEE1943215.1 peptidoglycan-binding domain-containing protein [Streptomyces sp. TRM 70361]